MNCQHPNCSNIRVVIEATDRFAHGIDAIGEREKRVEETEEGRHHLDWIQASSTRDLQHDNDDAKAFTNVLETSRQHVNNREIGQGTDHRCPNKSKLGDSLDPNDEISNRHNHCLPKSKERQKHPSRHITLDRAHGTDFLVIDLELQNYDKGERTDPQR